jgi:hypothetical protein
MLELEYRGPSFPLLDECIMNIRELEYGGPPFPLYEGQSKCSAQIVRIFLSTPAQLAEKRRKVEKEEETLA